MAIMTVDSIEWAGKRYTAEVRENDKKTFAMPCMWQGSRKCAIEHDHTAYVHLVIGSAQEWGMVEAI